MHRCFLFAVLAFFGPVFATQVAAETKLKFQVSLKEGLVKEPQNGRLLVVFGNGREPRMTLSQTGAFVATRLGRDVTGWKVGEKISLDAKCAIYPVCCLDAVKAGEYSLQAVLINNRDIYLHNAPGNLYSKAVKVTIDPSKDQTIDIELNESLGEEKLPADSANVKFVKLKSELLSKFHGRDMFLRAAVVLPAKYESDKEAKFPLRVHIGGFGTRFTSGRFFGRSSEDGPQLLTLVLDGAGPYGDPYQVNSANNGPWGDAITQELIPHVEKTYRGIGRGDARFLNGASTGGWVSLALQVFYPDFFNGCWSQCPDSLDFRGTELIDIYSQKNAYTNQWGFDRPSMRDLFGDVKYTVRNECQRENVLGLGDSFTCGGLDWGSWNATYSPRGKDGRPAPIWNPKTGEIDREVAKHWEKYDLRKVVEENWKTLAPKLNGKIFIWVGNADDYFLNKGVYYFREMTKRLDPPFEGRIIMEEMKGHASGGITHQKMLEEMVGRVKKDK